MQKRLLYYNYCNNRLVVEVKYVNDDIIRTLQAPVVNKAPLLSKDQDSFENELKPD